MELKIFQTLWGHQGSLDDAIADCRERGFDGIEGQVVSGMQCEFKDKLSGSNLNLIAEICTAGSYVPDRLAAPQVHLESLRRQVEPALESDPLFFTVIAGCDAWPVTESVDFFGKAMDMANELGVIMSFETHR